MIRMIGDDLPPIFGAAEEALLIEPRIICQCDDVLDLPSITHIDATKFTLAMPFSDGALQL